MGIYEGFLYGLSGGFLAELLGLFQLRHQAPDNLPKYLKTIFYWSVTIAMMCAGGGIVVAYLKSGASLSPLLTINIGASAPLTLKAFVGAAPPVDQGRIN